MQKTDRLNFDESTDIYKDIISGFKNGEDRPNFSILMAKLELGEYPTKIQLRSISRCRAGSPCPQEVQPCVHGGSGQSRPWAFSGTACLHKNPP